MNYRGRHLLLSAIVMLLALNLYSEKSFAENGKVQTKNPAVNQIANMNKIFKEAIERRSREILLERADEFLSKRLERSSYLIEAELRLDEKRIKEEVVALQGTDLDLIVRSISARRYDDLRKYLLEANIILTFSNAISTAEAEPLVKNLQNLFGINADTVEKVVAKNTRLPPTATERALKLQAEESRKDQVLREQTEARLKQLEHELRMKQLDKQFENELKMKQQSDGDKESAKEQLESERKKRMELTELMNRENIGDKIARDMPVLLRFGAFGLIFGVLILVAIVVASALFLLGIKGLAQNMRAGAEHLAQALGQLGGAGRSEKKHGNDASELHLNSHGAVGGNVGGGVQKGGNTTFTGKETELLQATRALWKEIRELATLEKGMAIAILGNAIDAKNYDSAFMMLDIFGPELSQDLLMELPQIMQRSLKRAYFAQEYQRGTLEQVFKQTLDLQSVFQSSRIVLKDSSEKDLGRIFMTHTEHELAQALASLDLDTALQLLLWFPPTKTMSIIRMAPKEIATKWRISLPDGLAKHKEIREQDVVKLTNALSATSSQFFEDNKNFFKQMLTDVDEKEYNEILEGLEQDPALCLAVIGVRATMEDLWAQPIPVLEKLFGQLNLDQIATFLYEAPDHLKANYFKGCAERRRLMLEDALQGLHASEQHLLKMRESIADIRKSILKELSNLCTDGVVELPSRKRLLDKINIRKAA